MWSLLIGSGRIVSQFHVIVDDKFETIVSMSCGIPPSDEWNRICKLDRDFFLDTEYNIDRKLVLDHLPDLHNKDSLCPKGVIDPPYVHPHCSTTANETLAQAIHFLLLEYVSSFCVY